MAKTRTLNEINGSRQSKQCNKLKSCPAIVVLSSNTIQFERAYTNKEEFQLKNETLKQYNRKKGKANFKI